DRVRLAVLSLANLGGGVLSGAITTPSGLGIWRWSSAICAPRPVVSGRKKALRSESTRARPADEVSRRASRMRESRSTMARRAESPIVEGRHEGGMVAGVPDPGGT